MSGRDPYRHIEAFIDQEQTEWTVGGRRQLVTVMMSGDSEAVGTAACQLTARQARDLAFQLLVEAEHADRLTDRRGEHDQ
jgi:hypothetical protein